MFSAGWPYPPRRKQGPPDAQNTLSTPLCRVLALCRVLYLALGRVASFTKAEAETTAPLLTQALPCYGKRQPPTVTTQSSKGCRVRTIGLSDQGLLWGKPRVWAGRDKERFSE